MGVSMTADCSVDAIDNVHPSLRACYHPVCRETDIPPAGLHRVRLLGEDWVIARIDGALSAMVDRCAHRFAPLSAGRVVDGAVECPYHGYRYGADGKCVLIPALGAGSPIPPKACVRVAHDLVVRYGLVWLAIDEPVVPIVDVPEWDDPAFVVAPLPDQQWHAGAGQMTENFLDMGHLAFLHSATFGDPDEKTVEPYTVERDGLGFVCDLTHSAKLLADSSGADQFDVAQRRSTWWYVAPFALRLRIEYYADDVVLTILFFHQPVDAETTKLYVFDLRNDIADGRTTIDDAIAFQMAVGAEDKAMLEQMVPKHTPLDAHAEVHTRADRNTLEMRRVLADFVDAAGARTAG
jgi:phenylpropionate dioxygenase-like ring-hydroxylating dioxygenase large terminal subunit